MSWVALSRLSELAQKYRWRTQYDYCGIAREIRQAIETYGYNKEIGAYTQVFGGSELDANLLVLPIVGYCHPNSLRIQNTINAIQKNLSVNGLVYRYKPGTGRDGLPGQEGAFGICNFWMAEALFRSARIQEGHQWFDSLISRSTHEIGLWSEEIDPNTGEFLGNYPQGFSHIGLINAAICCSNFSSRREAA
jgi:GH15 family glucan-1,4-alpha-glucosidase